MRKLNYLLLMLLLLGAGNSMYAQDTIRSLIISELRFDQWINAYTELTNMGDEAVDLSHFAYTCARPTNQYQFMKLGDVVYQTSNNGFPTANHTVNLHGILQPGESYVIMAVQDNMNNDAGGIPVQSIDLLMKADTVIHRPDWNGGNAVTRTWPYIPEWEMWGFDSLNRDENGVLNYEVFMSRPEREAACLYWHDGDENGDTISVLVDQCMLYIDWNTTQIPAPYEKTTAGIVNAADENNLVRKYSVKEGQTNWELAKGVDASTSQWIVIPHQNGLNLMDRTTAGNHGDYSIEVSSDIYTIGDGTISVPWGTEKFDSIRLGLTLGDGMAWWYRENGSFEDSLSTVCQDGDTLELYACGNEMEMKQYVVTVEAPTGDMVDVFARHNINYPDPEDDDYTPEDIALVGGVPYSVMEYGTVIDSIIDVPFATKVDTLLNLLEKAPNASWDIVWASGTPSNEIATGDLLRVTGGDGSTTKDYFIKTDDYVMSDNVELAAITWPDKTFAFREGWKGDTIPGFISTGSSYKIILPVNTKAVPALVATTAHLNATIEVDRAVSLSGGIAERTTTFYITSESDTTHAEVTVLLEVENPHVQNYVGHPFFSKFYKRIWWGSGMMEVCNPSGEEIDMSNYMMINAWAATTPADAILESNSNDSTQWLNRYNHYVPGLKYKSFTEWNLSPRVLELDNAVSPYVLAGDVLVFWKRHNNVQAVNEEIMEERYDVMMNSDFREPGTYANPWNEPINKEWTVAMPVLPNDGQSARAIYWMFEILNDSVKSGEKPATDPADFQVVDVFGHIDNGGWMIGNPDDGVKNTTGNNWRIKRLPHVYKGVTDIGEGLETDWYTDSHAERGTIPTAHRDECVKDLGIHVLDPITEQISTVSSLLYKVDKGYIGGLNIKGVSNGETVDDFIGNLILGDAGQVLMVYDIADGSVRAGTDPVGEGDSLTVMSRNGDNKTTYILELTALSDNATLTAVDGSGLTINIAGETGDVGGFDFGTTIRAIVDNVNVPELAIMNVIDANDNLVPLQKPNNDTVMVDLVASMEHFFEVVAQNGDKIVYQLMPASTGSDAFVLSDIYSVMEEPTRVVANITEGTGVTTFLANLFPVKGATMKIMLVSGQERTVGQVSLDDVLVVTSEDASVMVTYSLNFIGEMSAYVTSDVFTVDQENLDITVDANTTVAALVAGLTPAPEATVMVYDVDGNEKNSGDVLDTDEVMVTSGDGVNEVTYTITLLTSVYNSLLENLSVYPNPASSILYVKNIPMDAQVRVANITGSSIMVLEGFDTVGGISLEELNQGMYFLTVEKDGKVLATVKFIKK